MVYFFTMLSERARRLRPSPTLAIDSRAKALKAQGVDVINLGVGEPDFDTPEHIKEAARRAIRDGFTKYTPVGGILALKEAIAETFQAEQGVHYTPQQVLVSCGAKHSLYNIFQVLLQEGDEVLIPIPYWVSYPEQVALAGGRPVFVPTAREEGFRLEPQVLREHIGPRVKALVLNYPSNPTGLTYDRAALEAVAQVALEHGLVIISDEIYEKLLYDGLSHVSIASLGPELREKTVVVNGVSKAYAMTGWRIGWALGPEELIKAMTALQSQSTSNPTSIAQVAALEALRGPQEPLQQMLREFDARRRYLVEALNALEGFRCSLPQGAFYVFPHTQALYGERFSGSEELALYLLEQARVALVPGAAFGADGHLRLSYATALEELKRAVQRIAEALRAC